MLRQEDMILQAKNMPDLSVIHDCDKCHNKIVGISVDLFGNTYCGYCGDKVDYMLFILNIQRRK